MEGSGSLPDGAFERFVTSAIAAIITIVFSWRLLAEGQEQLGDTNRPRPPRICHEIASVKEKEKEKEKQPALDIPIDEDIQQVESNNVLASAPKYATLTTDCDRKQEEIDSPSWGDYKWEEDMYDTVHTRRNVNDFVVKRSSESSSDEHEMDSDIQLSPIPASHDMLEKLYMNQEYRSIVDDEGLCDTGSSSDSDENATEGVYEPPNVEQDMDMFYANGLEPIMEEDSDDLDSSENENDNDDDINENEDVCESENRTYSDVTSDNEPEGTRQDLVKHEEVNHQKDINASLTDADDDTSSLPDLADDNQFVLDNFIDECFDNCGEDYDNISDKTDSLPPSPIIRTRAIDEEYANLSDESCSSGSVITVVSVKSDYSDTPEIQIVEDSNKPLSFIYTDNESNLPDNLQGEDIIAFIHGGEEKQDYDFDLNTTPDNYMCNEFVDDEIKKSAPQKNELDYEDFIRDIQAVSETNNSSENAEKNEHVDENVNERKNDETDGEFTQNMCVDLFIKEDTEHLCANKSENPDQNCHSDDTFKFFDKSNEREEKIFDDDEGPREYNPYEDDFAEFDYCDSDDDSFYLVMGESSNLPNFRTFNNADSGNLRNFDTFDHLDAVGLSPGLDSSCESGLSDDGRFIFSRTEDISTEYRTRFYMKDREMEYETKNIHVDTCETEVVNKPEVDSVIENKNSYNESKLQNADSCDPIISDLENIELFIDESRIAENSCSGIESIDSNNELTIIDKVFSGINSTQTPAANNEKINNAVVNNGNYDKMSIPIEKNDTNEISTDDGLSPSSEEISEVSLEKGEHELISESSSLEKLNTKPFPECSYESSEENSPISCENGEFENSLKPCIEILSRAHDSGIDLDSDSSKLDITDDSSKPPSLSKKFEILDLIHTVKGQIDRSSTVKPSLFKGDTKTRIQQQQQKHRSKSYVSVLQQPMSLETTRSVAVVLPERNVPKSRQQIIASRTTFLSEQNLLSDDMQEQFQHHKTSFEQVSQRKPRYLRRGNSLPRSSRNRKSYEKLDFNSLNSSRSSVEKPDICTLHENCIFSPQKHQEILNRTLSIENLELNLMRYGSVTSLVETDIDSGETTEYQVFTDFENDFEFQLPLERTASMSELGTRKKNKTETKGRFSERNVPKSKSLCTLETNIDDVDETPQPGTLGRVPSVHELRVTKSLQKLNIPDWYKKSSVSRSGSTWSLYSTPRKDSFSSYNYPPSITSSPCPSVSLGSNSVVIRTRVTPSSAKLFRSPKLQTTPEKSPTPISVQLPSDKLRQKEKPKELMPIPIVPFTKLRLMFEENSRRLKPTSLSTKPSSMSPVATPTTPVSPMMVHEIEIAQPAVSTEQSMTKPSVPTKPILKKKKTATTPENKNVVRVEPQQATPVSVQPMSTSPRSGRRVETTFNGSVGQTEVRSKPKETTFEGEKPVQIVRPEIQEQKVTPQISNTTENQNEHNSKSARYSSLSKSLKSAFRRPQKSSSSVEAGGSKIETTV